MIRKSAARSVILLILLYVISPSIRAQERDSIVTLPEVVITNEWMVNEKIDRSFASNFPEAYDIVWRKLNKSYLTKFIQVDLKHQTLFRKNGTISYDIMYMPESHLPANIAELVHDTYNAYVIKNAARIQRAGQAFWIVNLEGIRSYVVLRVEDGDLSEVKRIEKANP